MVNVLILIGCYHFKIFQGSHNGHFRMQVVFHIAGDDGLYAVNCQR